MVILCITEWELRSHMHAPVLPLGVQIRCMVGAQRHWCAQPRIGRDGGNTQCLRLPQCILHCPILKDAGSLHFCLWMVLKCYTLLCPTRQSRRDSLVLLMAHIVPTNVLHARQSRTGLRSLALPQHQRLVRKCSMQQTWVWNCQDCCQHYSLCYRSSSVGDLHRLNLACVDVLQRSTERIS